LPAARRMPRWMHDGVGRYAAANNAAPLKVSILMCAYNEEQRIERAINEVLLTCYPCDIELIVVDDGSTDNTALIAEKIGDPRLIVHRHGKNMGKGQALRTASHVATGTHILPFDVDLAYAPQDIPRLIAPVIRWQYDVVYGARVAGFNSVYRLYRYALGDWLLTRIANLLFTSSISDLRTCLKLVPLELFRRLTLRDSRFGLDAELTATLLRLGFRPFEVPVSYHSRSRAQGGNNNWRDTVACLAILLKVRVIPTSQLPLVRLGKFTYGCAG
jgi:dolichol-phosphate hexosyltransferase